jgi:hypothetical protein
MELRRPITHAVTAPAGGPVLRGDLTIPENAAGVVAFAHGSGSGGTVREIASWPES